MPSKARLGPRGQSVQDRGIATLLLSLRGLRRPSCGLRFYRNFYRTGRSGSMSIDGQVKTGACFRLGRQ